MNTDKLIVKRKTGEDFILSNYGAFSDEYKKYQSLKGDKSVEYLLSIGFTEDKTKWLNKVHSNKENYPTMNKDLFLKGQDFIYDGDSSNTYRFDGMYLQQKQGEVFNYYCEVEEIYDAYIECTHRFLGQLIRVIITFNRCYTHEG